MIVSSGALLVCLSIDDCLLAFFEYGVPSSNLNLKRAVFAFADDDRRVAWRFSCLSMQCCLLAFEFEFKI